MFQRGCVLGIIAVFSAGVGAAIAGPALPVVNLAGNGISARAAFGDPLYGALNSAPASAPSADLAAANFTLPPEPMPKLNGAPVSRPSAPAPRAPARAADVPKFARAAASSTKPDILSPQKPDDDLWAQNSGNAKRPIISRAAALVPAIKSGDGNLTTYDFADADDDANAAMPSDAFADNAVVKPTFAIPTTIAQNDDIAPTVRAAVTAKPAPRPRIADTIAANRITPPTKQIANFTIGTIRPQPKIQVADNMIPTADLIKPDDSKIVTSRVVVPMDDITSYNPSRDASVTVANADDKKPAAAQIAQNDDVPLTKLSPLALKRAFEKTYISENKHLSTYKINDQFDVASDMNTQIQGFDTSRDLSETSGGVRPLEIKMSFRGDDSALSHDNYNLLTEYAGIVSNNPKRAIQVSIPERSTRSYDGRKLAARRLAIISQVLRDTGVADQRIIPVLTDRSDDAFVLSIISNDTFQTLTQKQRDMFGDTVSSKTYKSMTW